MSMMYVTHTAGDDEDACSKILVHPRQILLCLASLEFPYVVLIPLHQILKLHYTYELLLS